MGKDKVPYPDEVEKAIPCNPIMVCCLLHSTVLFPKL